MIKITQDPIDVSAVTDSVADDGSGATVLFLGTVRDHSDETSQVSEMYYEVYTEMAEAALKEIEDEAIRRWKLKKFVAIHRVGTMQVGEVSVAIAVSAEHRKEAFEACQYAIDTIKKTVPLWKKEISGSGSRWVKGVKLESTK
ncbi:molybdenum cofactor biosynthesis protein MoaE [Candidatus Bathyarchaeota archaeon]|nr:molybdenum cofactor biosynthesis protein MoaE [Candidatus Bathyarchaeota archaeon]